MADQWDRDAEYLPIEGVLQVSKERIESVEECCEAGRNRQSIDQAGEIGCRDGERTRVAAEESAEVRNAEGQVRAQLRRFGEEDRQRDVDGRVQVHCGFIQRQFGEEVAVVGGIRSEPNRESRRVDRGWISVPVGSRLESCCA